MRKQIEYLRITGNESPLIHGIKDNNPNTIVVYWQDSKGKTGIIKIRYK